ncbi:MAG TPA: hypothetical protein VGG10_06365 [Rhizomicrobium sp.]|jgi:hypothetical protein
MNRRDLTALAASLLLLAAPSSVAAKATKPHTSAPARLNIAPGASLALPQGWFGCDNTVVPLEGGGRLPNATHPFCRFAGVRPDDRMHLIHIEPSDFLSLIVAYDKLPFVRADVLADNRPEVLQEMNKLECLDPAAEMGIPNLSILSCNFMVGTAAGHPALIGTFAGKTPNDPAHLVRDYQIPYEQGDLMLQFEMPAANATAGSAAADAIVRSLVLAALAEAPPAPPPVNLVPAPGVTLSLPANWMACDDNTNALLGNVSDPDNVRKKSCAEATDVPDAKLFAFNPQMLRNVTIQVQHKMDQDISPSDLQKVKPSQLPEIAAKQCPFATQQITAHGDSVESCDISLTQIDGHPALQSTVVIVPKDGGEAERDKSVTYFVPYDQGYLTLATSFPVLCQAACQPMIDAVIGSITIQ